MPGASTGRSWPCGPASSATATPRPFGPPTVSGSSASTARSRSCTTSARCRAPPASRSPACRSRWPARRRAGAAPWRWSMGPDPARFAELLCDYCLEVRPGQQVSVRSTTHAAPLLLALEEALLEREAWPLVRAALPDAEEVFWRAARDAHLDGFAPAELAEAEGTDASLRIQAPDNTRALSAVAAERMARAARARSALREAALQRRWCVTLWPTAAGAQQAGMGTAEFAAFVRGALFLDRADA